MTSLLPSSSTRGETSRVGVDLIHDIIDHRRVRTVFQPLVHLPTRQIVGYEALSRGPAGTVLESPLALLDAARAVGRLYELDWTCRAVAAQAVLDRHMDPSLTLLVNLEPETLGSSCPDNLWPVIAEARSRLHVIAEFTERALAADPSLLLGMAARLRQAAWGIALDDVGAEPAALALLPFVQPDVVKLDLRLVQRRTDAEIAAIVNAVRAYAEDTGAVILAEGIETTQHERVARVLGATYAQGWLYGRPEPLPPATRPTDNPLPLLAVAGTATAATPFEVVSRARPTAAATKQLLLPMSHHLENQAFVGASPVVLSCFQDARHFTSTTRQRYGHLAMATTLTAALGVGLADAAVPGVRGAALAADDPLGGEWSVIVVGPHFSGALVARDRGDSALDSQRRFDFVITHDRQLVVRAARTVLRRITALT
jgi:EAL domain-containing protein (putative c-di-GMP-specific phosphodiesterase class I)